MAVASQVAAGLICKPQPLLLLLVLAEGAAVMLATPRAKISHSNWGNK